MTARYQDRMLSAHESGWPGLTTQATFTGMIVHWNSEKGLGFIRRDDGQRDIFVHNLQVVHDVEALAIGTLVAFVPGHSMRSHRPQALDVRMIEA